MISPRLLTCGLAAMLSALPCAAQQRTPEQIAELRRLAEPGESHRRLDVLAGKWNIESGVETPGRPRQQGTAEFSWSMGGRFLIEEVKASWMGRPMEWMGIHGYDNLRKQHASAWIDNLGTRIQHFDGRFLPDGTTLLYQAELDDPVAGKSTLEWAYVLESPDRYTATMTVIDKNGKRNLAMRLVGTRAK